jgi:hypothetical protein
MNLREMDAVSPSFPLAPPDSLESGAIPISSTLVENHNQRVASRKIEEDAHQCKVIKSFDEIHAAVKDYRPASPNAPPSLISCRNFLMVGLEYNNKNSTDSTNKSGLELRS